MTTYIDKICDFIKERTAPFGGAVIGLSGGIDSSVVAYLTARAIGSKRMYGLCLPYKNQSFEDGLLVAEKLQMPCEIVQIEPMVDAFLKGDEEPLVKGNLMARVRMCCLYMKANKTNSLVIGTTNASEFAIGYCTKWGDSAVDLEPIMHLLKTEVFAVGEFLGVPENIIKKAPSAELWSGQTDEGELGFTYAMLDDYITGGRFTGKKDFSSEITKKIEAKIKSALHKKIPIPMVGSSSSSGFMEL